MRKSFVCILMLGLLLSVALPVWADAAPPREPPGSSILPAGQTQVQMLAETVSLVVQPAIGAEIPLKVTALFAMRNQGQATESMQVRFPMENPDGQGDGYGLRPLLKNFTASVGGTALPITYLDESLTSDSAIINWAAFPVDFPPGRDVAISVSYTTLLAKSNNGTDQATAEYILETGAGWYGPIGSALVTLTLPYTASPSNVFLPYEGDQQGVPAPVFLGKQVRWEWSQLEPDQTDNVQVVFIWPQQWQDILTLQAAADQAPRNPKIAIDLAEAYRNSGSERHGFVASQPLARLARQTLQNALAYNPANPDLQAKLITIDLWRCTYADPACSQAEIQNALQAYDIYLKANPDSASLADAAYFAPDLRSQLETPDLPTPEATQPAEAIPTLERKATATSAPTQTPLPTVTAILKPSLTATPSFIVGPTPAPNRWLFFWAGLSAGIIGLLALGAAIWGLRTYRKERH